MRSTSLPIVVSCCVAVLAANSLCTASALHGQTSRVTQRSLIVPVKRTVTLDPLTQQEASAPSMVKLTQVLHRTPENFRQFDALSVGQIGDAQTLMLRFAAAAKLLTIKSTPEFKIEQGGSCVEGYTYAANSTCTLLIRSTPQGPGKRLGKIEIANSADVTPWFVGLGGFGYAPTISFTPSIISTVPGTYASGSGIVSGGTSLAVDGGDNLYIADTGHNTVEYIDSSGEITEPDFSGELSSVVGVAVDPQGEIYTTQRNSEFLFVDHLFSGSQYYAGGGACDYGSTCALYEADIDYSGIGALAEDPSGNIFMNTNQTAAKLVSVSGVSLLDYIPLVTPYNFNSAYPNAPQPLAVDSSDTLYTYTYGGPLYNGLCFISGESYYSAETATYNPVTVAGGQNCGFSGDGGQARGAELGEEVGQMTFDLAGNFYFSDTLNQRVRRIDGATGIITTIAGNGATGYSGDGGPASSAALNTPTGVAVDSQGQVYILSSSATTGTAQVVRKVGVVGALNLGYESVGNPSPAQTIQLANTGNSELDFTHVGFSSGNTSDFAMDVNTTSCNFTVPLAAGRSCKIGFIFTPSATGARSAVLSITDDTVTGLNTVQVSGTGFTAATLTPASFSFVSTTVGSASAPQTATLTNTGKAVMTISSIVLSGAGATSYSDTTSCTATLAVGSSCTIALTFKPATAGTLAAALTVNDNALGGRQVISLTGVGAAAAAKPALSPSSLTFTSTVGSASAAQTIKLSNTGGTALGVTSIKMTGTDPGDYALTQTCGTSVAAGGSCTITLTFKPTATGTRAASVSAVTSTGTLTATVTGTAKAAAAKVSLMTAANPSLRRILTFTVTVDSPVAATGRVQLKEGDRIWAESSFSDEKIVFRVNEMAVGVHVLNAVYSGDKEHLGSSSATLRQMVEP